MACNHEFVTSGQLGPAHCRCRHCLSSFPVSMWCEQLQRKFEDLAKLFGVIQRRTEHLTESGASVEDTLLVRMMNIESKMREFEGRVLASLTEPVVLTGTPDFDLSALNAPGVVHVYPEETKSTAGAVEDSASEEALAAYIEQQKQEEAKKTKKKSVKKRKKRKKRKVKNENISNNASE